jgi:hypothetical protein
MGILRQAWNSETPIYHFWGLPFASSTREDAALECQFIHALLWQPSLRYQDDCLSRRHGFPSWSWFGWRGLLDIWTPMKQDVSFIDTPVHIEDSSGNDIHINEYIQKIDTGSVLSDFAPVVHLTCWFTNVRIIDCDPHRSGNMSVADESGRAFASADVFCEPAPSPDIFREPVPDRTSMLPHLWPVGLFFMPGTSGDSIIVHGLILRKIEGDTYERFGGFDRSYRTSSCRMTTYSSESARVEVLSVEDLVKYGVEIVVATLDCVRRTIRLV